VGTYALRVGPLEGTRYGIYAANWSYGMRMSILDVWTWPRENVCGLACSTSTQNKGGGAADRWGKKA
jgi:hypothetical protein